jgi:hypothetical protein
MNDMWSDINSDLKLVKTGTTKRVLDEELTKIDKEIIRLTKELDVQHEGRRLL